MTSQLGRLLGRFKRVRLLVVGDAMLDRFVMGEVTRINPEAPVPVLRVRREYAAPGGAGNAAANAASLGASVTLTGYVGQDQAGRQLRRLLRSCGVRDRLITTTRPTTTKIRAVARGQQLLRLDYERDGPAVGKSRKKLLAEVRQLAEHAEAVLVSDYAKGAVTRELMEFLAELARRGKVVTVDPRPQHVDFYRGVTLVTPNLQEAAACLRREIRTKEDIRRAGRDLAEKLDCHVLLTRGEEGMSFFQRHRGSFDLPTEAKEVADVTGAGDTVAVAVTLGLAAGLTVRQAVKLANIAAGIVVSKVGTAAVTFSELKQALR